MADYWKSQDKKYCEICKCWITDNTLSVQVHQNGVRHKMNAQEKLREIQKKAKAKDKNEKKFAKSLRQIEEAAAAASQLDKTANPDMSLKIQSYLEHLREQDISLGGTGSNSSATGPKEQAAKAKILHREEKDTSMEVVEPKPYTSRFGGWTPVQKTGPKLDLELPSSSYSVSAGKVKKKKSSIPAPIPGITAPPISYTAKVKEKPRHVFTEKVIPAASTATSTIKLDAEPAPEVAFKKRKFNRPNARQAIND